MRRFLAVAFGFLLVAGLVQAAGYSKTFDLVSGTVTISNQQENSRWIPTTVMLGFDASASGSVQIFRDSDGRSFKLASATFSNVTSVVWIPDAEYSFGFGEALRIECTATNGAAQVSFKGD